MGSKPRGISASRGAAILGLSEFQTPLEVWQCIMEEREPGFNAKNGYIIPDDLDSAAIRWGLAFEVAIAELSERAQGKNIINRELTCFVRSYNGYGNVDYITCHIDGMYNSTDVLHEGKTTNAISFRNKWGEPGTDKIPSTYQVQVQHQMLCTGASECIVSLLVFPEMPEVWEKSGWYTLRRDCKYIIQHEDNLETDILLWARVLSEMGYFHQYKIKANHDVQKMLVKYYSEFWHNYVLTGKPPEPRNYDDIKRLIPNPVGTIVCDAQMTAWILEYNAIAKELSKTGNAAKRQEKLKLRILNQARKLNPIMDEESQEKVIFLDNTGKKLKQYSNKGGFR